MRFLSICVTRMWVALGWLGGKRGGKMRAEKLTSAQRKRIANKAAQARWSGKPAIA
jgi:hypothetical protein